MEAYATVLGLNEISPNGGVSRVTTPANHNEMAAYTTVLGLNDFSPNGKHMKGACHDIPVNQN